MRKVLLPTALLALGFLLGLVLLVATGPASEAGIDETNGTEGVIDFRDGGTPRWRVPQAGGFTISCYWRDTGNIDPIVSYGMPSAHSHDIAGGNLTTTSTFPQLMNDDTSCDEPTHHTAYWFPGLEQQDPQTGEWRHVGIGFVHIYQRAIAGEPTDNLEPMQNRMKIIAGSSASDGVQRGVVDWGCSGSGNGPAGYLKPVSCDPNGPNPWVKLLYRFPNCYQTDVFDSPDHRSHASYPMGYPQDNDASVCPAGFDREVPIPTVSIKFKTHSGEDLRLTSGPVSTAHADIFSAMDRDVYRESMNATIKR